MAQTGPVTDAQPQRTRHLHRLSLPASQRAYLRVATTSPGRISPWPDSAGRTIAELKRRAEGTT
jgi:hypothetical protein